MELSIEIVVTPKTATHPNSFLSYHLQMRTKKVDAVCLKTFADANTLAASKRKGVFDEIQNKTIQRLWNNIKMWINCLLIFRGQGIIGGSFVGWEAGEGARAPYALFGSGTDVNYNSHKGC